MAALKPISIEDAVSLSLANATSRMRLRAEKPQTPFDFGNTKFAVVTYFPIVVTSEEGKSVVTGEIYYTSHPLEDRTYVDSTKCKMSAPNASNSTIVLLNSILSHYPSTADHRFVAIESPINFTEDSVCMAFIAALLGGPLQYYTGTMPANGVPVFGAVADLADKVKHAFTNKYDIVVPTANHADIAQMANVPTYGAVSILNGRNPKNANFQAIVVDSVAEMLLTVPIVFNANFRLEVAQDPARVAFRKKLKDETAARNTTYRLNGTPPIMYYDLDGNMKNLNAADTSAVVDILSAMQLLVDGGDLKIESAQGLANAYFTAEKKNDLAGMYDAARAITRNFHRKHENVRAAKPTLTVVRKGPAAPPPKRATLQERIAEYRKRGAPPSSSAPPPTGFRSIGPQRARPIATGSPERGVHIRPNVLLRPQRETSPQPQSYIRNPARPKQAIATVEEEIIEDDDEVPEYVESPAQSRGKRDEVPEGGFVFKRN